MPSRPGAESLQELSASLSSEMDKFAAMSLIKSCGVDRVFRLERNSPGNS